MKRETLFRKKVRAELSKLPRTKFTPIQQITMVGDPDFVLCIRGRYVELELKDREGKLGRLQQEKLTQTVLAGGQAFVADQDNWPVVLANLRALAEEKA